MKSTRSSKKPDTDLDSELVWWPWGTKKDAERDDAPSRLSRPWRAIFLVLLQALLIWGVLSLDEIVNGVVNGLAPEDPSPEPLVTSDTIEELRARQLFVPVVGVERSELRGSFGDPRGLRRHKGIDIAAPRHRPVVAVEAGRITRLANGRLSGRAVHQLSPRGLYSYFYAHLEAFAEGLEEGDRVAAGQLIGYVGSSGNAATPHLHFAIKRLGEPGRSGRGRPIDPFIVLRP